MFASAVKNESVTINITTIEQKLIFVRYTVNRKLKWSTVVVW